MRFILLFGFALASIACSTDTDSKAKKIDGIFGGTPKALLKTSLTLAGPTTSNAPPFGHANASGLHSLKYYITSMGICRTAKIKDTGFTMGADCLELYTAPKDERYENTTQTIPTVEQYKAFADAARADDDNPHFIDLMSAASRATMARSVTVTTEHIGEYRYGYVYWYYPIKMKADVTLEDGTRLHTHDGETKSVVHPGGFVNVYTESPVPFTEGVAEETVIIQQNGGNWFRFQTPFTITDNDLVNAVEFKLELAFNPEGAIKGAGPAWSSNSDVLVDADIASPGNQFLVPLLDLAPIMSRADERALRESYLFDVSAPTGNQFQLRYDLYYAEPRPDAILAVETKTLVTSGTTGRVAHGVSVSGVDADTEGSLTFKKWDGTALLSQFARATSPGDAVNAVLHCKPGIADPLLKWCDNTNLNPVQGTLVGIFPVSE